MNDPPENGAPRKEVNIQGGKMTEGPAYVIGHLTVKDPEKWAEYRRKVPATLAEWGGELVFRGKIFEVLSGIHSYTDVCPLRPTPLNRPFLYCRPD
jgi:hypothetical protein